MSKTKTLIASESRKGREIIRQTCEIALDECGLEEDALQRVVERGRELQTGFKELVIGLALPQDFAGEEIVSSYVYPPEYRLRSIREQVERLLMSFPNLNATWALERGQRWYDSLTLPKWVEGPLVYPWWEFFGTYRGALAEILKKLADSRAIYNYREGRLGPEYLRQTELTARLEALIKVSQPGDLLIVPSQAGLRWRGKSVRRGRVLYAENEFGLGSVAECARALTHPERYGRWEQLHTDLGGDDCSPLADDPFDRAPSLRFGDGKLKFDVFWVGFAHENYGPASAFFPPSTAYGVG